MTHYERWDVVLVPFPFTDLSSVKKRPAVILSPRRFNDYGDLIIGFLTSNLSGEYKLGDYVLKNHAHAGLPLPSKFRLKIATISDRIVVKNLGRLAEDDHKAINEIIGSFLKDK
jgi:mRNA interferase MazF